MRARTQNLRELQLFGGTIVSLVLVLQTVAAAVAEEKTDQASAHTDVFSTSVRPVLLAKCVKCHGQQEEVQGEVNLLELGQREALVSQPELLRNLIDVLDSGYMPPEEAPELPQAERRALVQQLEQLLHESVSSRRLFPSAPIRRMNRFQYNNAVQDLFELNVVVFPLPERMLREHGNYFQPESGNMPRVVRVGSRPLGKSQLIERRLGGVTPFPQDLRAEHGFDTQADHLTLSPLLLESFVRLARSIVESPDFHAQTCGIWAQFFAAPEQVETADIEAEVRQRLEPFLTRAFRRPVDEPSLDRYTAYVLARLEAGEPFSGAMKEVAAATLASPRFFYLYRQQPTDQEATSQPLDDFDLASRLSFFLWGSIPDHKLLELAAQDQLHEPEVLAEQVDRMRRNPKLKRFCDSFPAQWLQLDRIISSTPDRQKYPQFYFSKYRASMHMMLEPLLLFETILIENRSLLELIDSDFSYRSKLLQAWYRDGTQGQPGSPVVVQFERVPVTDRREGGVITTAAVMTMTSGVRRTKPITRGAWVASVILNDPPEPPPADVPPLTEVSSAAEQDLTIRERFAVHRKRADCASCHRRIDPLGFALENYDAAGIWRDRYENGRTVDASGTLFGRHEFTDVTQFKEALLAEKQRFTRALASHLLSFALGREVRAEDSVALDQIVERTAEEQYRFQSLLKQVVLSDSFRH